MVEMTGLLTAGMMVVEWVDKMGTKRAAEKVGWMADL